MFSKFTVFSIFIIFILFYNFVAISYYIQKNVSAGKVVTEFHLHAAH